MKNFKKLIVPASITAGVLLIGIVLYYFLSNKKERTNYVIDPQYAEFVSAITSGVISSESTIRVVLVEPYKGDSLKRDEVLNKVFSFSPSISGVTRWADENTVEFVPDKPLESGMHYEAEFALYKITSVPDNLKYLKFAFTVIKQDIAITEDGLKTVGGNADVYSISGALRSADAMNGEIAEKLVRSTLQGNDIKLRWVHSSDRKTHTFTADSIARSDEAQTLYILWDGKDAGIENAGNYTLEIPAKGTFKVLDARQISGAESYIKVIFSDPLEQGQNLDGLITLSDLYDLKYTIEENIVKVYYNNSSNRESFELVVNEGILNRAGKRLPERYLKGLNIQQIKPGVELIGKGVIMPNSGNITLPFRSVNLKAVDITIIKVFENNIPQFLQINDLNGVRELKRVGRPVYKGKVDLTPDHVIDYNNWNTFSLNLSNYIKADPGALYRVIFSFRKAYSLFPCEVDSNAVSTEGEEVISVQDQDNFSDYDVSDTYGYYDYYSYYYEEGEGGNYWEQRDNPCHSAYYNNDRFPSCNILASNLGLTAKLNKNNELNIVVTDINTAKPISGVTLDILDYQQQVMTTGSTNSDGFAKLVTPHRPFLVIAKQDKERGYLSLTSGSTLSLSTFDVGGAEIQKGLKGFIYGDRGVWRPGDTLFLTFILEDKNQTLPKNHPIIFELTDARGKLFKRLIKTANVNGFYTFAVQTDEKSPTGNWNAKVKAGGAEFNKELKIETIKPNRLEVNLDLGNKPFAESNLSGVLSAKWLHGAIAGGLKARMAVTLSKSTTTFTKYPNYTFDDPSRDFSSEEQVIFEGNLDENGKTNITANIDPGTKAPGMLKAGFITKIFEESGDFSIDFLSMPFSPYDYYVGLMTPPGQGWGDMLYVDTTQTIKVASVDSKGNPVSRTGIDVEVYRMDWRWWWDGSDGDLATFFSSSYNSPVFSKTISTTNGNGQFGLKITDWGRYLIRVKDADGHASSRVVYFDWPGWYTRSRDNGSGGASIISIATDKQKYKVGETAKVTIPVNAKAKALVSVESGSKIISMFWADMRTIDDKRASIDIPITSDMAPNVFVNVTLLQPHEKMTNDAPIRLFGYTPILVEDPETILEPVLKAPDKVGSEELFNISVNEKNGKAMTYTIAIVDEGLLSLTRFKTPDPHSAFYAREALGIKTWDMFDLVFGAFGGKIEQVFGIGGDQDMAAMKSKKNAERFKPVVKFLGPFTLKDGEKKTHAIKLPKYNGAVRIMLVAGQDGAYGNTEKSIKVKNSLMIMATLPRILGPAESVTMPVTVFADDEKVKKVDLEVITNNLLIPMDGKSKSVSFSKPGNSIVNFNFKVPQQIGVATVKILARSGNLKAEYDVELNVRNPNPPAYEYSGTIVGPGQQINQQLTMIGMAGTNKASIEVSVLPPLDLNRHLSYLIHYPYGCIEQTTSSVFPQLFLDQLIKLSSERVNQIENNIKAGIDRIKSFQTKSGGLSYWPGQYDDNPWGTNYGGHFMMEAERKGYKLPTGFKQAWIKYQQTKAKGWTGDENTYYYYSDYGLTQAYRLYTLALAGSPELGAMNRLREKPNKSEQTRWMLASAYTLAGQPEVANQLIANLNTNIKEYIETGYTFGSDMRDRAMILETYSLMKDFNKASILAEDMAKRLSSASWFGTHTLAYCLVAMAEYAKASNLSSGEIVFSYKLDNEAVTNVSSTLPFYQIIPDVKLKPKLNVNLANKNKGAIYVRYYLEGIPVAGFDSDAESNMTLAVSYKDMKGNIINPELIKQGTDFKVDVTVRNVSSIDYVQNIALTHVVPSGWEIINTRIGDIDAGGKSDQPDYQDIRDDRIMNFFNLKPNESKTFTFTFNGSYLGNYYLPSVNVEAMYDHRIYARKAGKWVKVVE